MERENRNFVIALGVVVVIVLGGYAALIAYTGFTVPFSTVVSESMQHDNDRSSVGIIDTGDIVIVADPSKVEIQSYFEGYETGYESFGYYGSVIIYSRGGSQNPVIHRAILWLDWNADTGTWSSEELANSSLPWHCEYRDEYGRTVTSKDPYNLRGTLYLEDVYGKTPYVNLDSLPKSSGYLTMGDNPVTNQNFDFTLGINSGLVSMEQINSVAIAEIPWLGTLKLFLNGSSHLSSVPNSLPSLVMVIVLVILLIVVADAVSVYRYRRKNSEAVETLRRYRRD